MSNQVILVGGFIEIIELCEENDIQIHGIIDNCGKDTLYSYNVLGNDQDALTFQSELKGYPLILSPDRPDLRKKLKQHYQELGFNFFQIISSYSKISKSASIGEGTIVQAGVNVSSEVEIGHFVKLNSMANVMHNSTIGDLSTIAPNAVILGYVSIGEECYIGANATIMPRIKIADRVTIGAGAVLTKDIHEQGAIYAGVPAIRIK